MTAVNDNRELFELMKSETLSLFLGESRNANDGHGLRMWEQSKSRILCARLKAWLCQDFPLSEYYNVA